MKVCSRCSRELLVVDFHLKGGGYRRPECKECFKASRPRSGRTADAGIRASNKAAYQRYYKYGMTDEEYRELLRLQCGVCAICSTSNPGSSDWQVDHDHSTGRVRGLLCRACNIALGLMGDDTDRMTRAIEYLSGATRQAQSGLTA